MKYTHERKIETLALLAVNNGNISKTSRDTGISRQILRAWQDSELADLPEVTSLKKELTDSRRQLMREVLEAAFRRMLEIIPIETDLYKLAGTLKIVQGVELTANVGDAIHESMTGNQTSDDHIKAQA
jgi:hypothetical protein